MSEWGCVGKILRPFKLDGLMKVASYCDPVEKIFDYLPWYIGNNKKPLTVEQSHNQSAFLVAKAIHVTDRNEASVLTNEQIYIKKEQLELLGDQEFYWHELNQMTVVSSDGTVIGSVEYVTQHNQIDMIVVKAKNNHELMIPLVDPYFLGVDKSTGILKVDWPYENNNN